MTRSKEVKLEQDVLAKDLKEAMRNLRDASALEEIKFIIKNLKDTDGCCGCKYEHDSIEICKLRDCWRAIDPKDAYEDKEEDNK